MKLENILKNKDKYIIELLERNEDLNIENRKLKEEKQANIDAQSGGVLKIKVKVSMLYIHLLTIRNRVTNTSEANIHISDGKYVKLEPID
jgi:hypothetical protein